MHIHIHTYIYTYIHTHIWEIYTYIHIYMGDTHIYLYVYICGFLAGVSGKESACQFRRHKKPGLDPCQEDPLEMATHSIILTWEIPWTEEPGERGKLMSPTPIWLCAGAKGPSCQIVWPHLPSTVM